jgi:hypothetical protein
MATPQTGPLPASNPTTLQPSLTQRAIGTAVKTMAPTVAKKMAPHLAPTVAKTVASSYNLLPPLPFTRGNLASQTPAEARNTARKARRPGPFSNTVLGPLIRMRARQLSRHLKNNQLSGHNQLSRYQKDNQPQLPEQPVAASHSKRPPRMILQPQRQSSASTVDR